MNSGTIYAMTKTCKEGVIAFGCERGLYLAMIKNDTPIY
jgi:hypothetical protein